MTDSADLRFLLAIQSSGSLIATARLLGVTPSAVTQRLQQLERKLDARLVNRTARRLRFTEEGLMLCERGTELIRELDALGDALHASQGGMVGTLAINAPLGFGRRYLAPLVAEYQREFPDIDISLTLSDRPLAESASRFDVIVHIGELRVSNLVGHAIAPNARYLCASPAYVKRYGLPDAPDDLAMLPCIVLHENDEDVTQWHFSKGRTTRSVRVMSKLGCNDGDVIRRWALEGRGAMLRSEWDIADDLKSGKLVRLLPAWKAPDANVIALTQTRSGLPQRTRRFMQYMQAQFRPNPPWRK